MNADVTRLKREIVRLRWAIALAFYSAAGMREQLDHLNGELRSAKKNLANMNGMGDACDRKALGVPAVSMTQLRKDLFQVRRDQGYFSLAADGVLRQMDRLRAYRSGVLIRRLIAAGTLRQMSEWKSTSDGRELALIALVSELPGEARANLPNCGDALVGFGIEASVYHDPLMEARILCLRSEEFVRLIGFAEDHDLVVNIARLVGEILDQNQRLSAMLDAEKALRPMENGHRCVVPGCRARVGKTELAALWESCDYHVGNDSCAGRGNLPAEGYRLSVRELCEH